MVAKKQAIPGTFQSHPRNNETRSNDMCQLSHPPSTCHILYNMRHGQQHRSGNLASEIGLPGTRYVERGKGGGGKATSTRHPTPFCSTSVEHQQLSRKTVTWHPMTSPIIFYESTPVHFIFPKLPCKGSSSHQAKRRKHTSHSKILIQKK